MEILNSILAKLPSLVDSLVYVAIALITIVGFMKCVAPVIRTGSALKRGVRRLEKHAGSETPAWKEPRFLGRALQGSWQRFLFNADQLTYRGLSLNIDDYINDDTVVHTPGNGSFAELVPSLLTSLGILGTFIGLMNGLAGVDFTNAEKLIAAIPTLLDGMSYAFATSVAGITCSLAFNVIYRIVVGRAFKAIDGFSDAFCQLALCRAPDDSVQLICQNQDRNVLLHNVSEDMSTKVAGSIETAISRSMVPVTQSMDRFIAAATREQVDGIGRIATHFIVKMNESLSGQFLALGKTMTEVNQNTILSNETLQASLSAAGSLVTDMQTLHMSSNEILARFETYIQALNQAGEEDKAFKEKTSELISKMHQAQEQQTRCVQTLNDSQAKLEKGLREYTTFSDEILNGIKVQGQSSANEIGVATSAFKDSSTLLSQSYSSFVENVTEGLSRAIGMFEENTHDMLRVLSDKADKLAAASSSEKGQMEAYSQLQKTMADIQKTLAAAEEA